jgi:hypothetical protein
MVYDRLKAPVILIGFAGVDRIIRHLELTFGLRLVNGPIHTAANPRDWPCPL